MIDGVKFSAEIRRLIWGRPFGSTYPPRQPPPPPVYDGRTAALSILRKYIEELTFYRPGGKDPNGVACPPIEFQIPKNHIHVEWPDDEVELGLPSISFLSQGPANYDGIGLTCHVDEKTKDVYSPGTVLTWLSEYQEDVLLEVWAETKAQRRAIVLGLEVALSPLEYMAGLRFVMPDYYGQLATFALQTRELIDDDGSTKLRRKARLVVNLRFHVVALVAVEEIDPRVELSVDVDELTGVAIDLDGGESPEDDGDPREPGQT
jgi:hypothetical protein